jgi:hypothetical protein
MNKCHLFKELSSYLDNQLSEEQKLRMDEHLKTCSMCSQELSRLRALSEKLKAWQIADLDASFDASVRDEIVARELERGEVKMKKKTIAILVPSGVLAGILVMIFLGQFYIKGGYQGKLRQAADDIGGTYARIGLASRTGSASFGLGQKSGYEPYYFAQKASSDYAFELKNALPAAKKDYAMSNEVMSLRRGLGSEGAAGIPSTQAYSDTQAYQGSVIVIQPVLPATGEGEKIIRSAEVRLEVEDGKTAYKKALEICQELGGYLAASNFYKDAEGRESGTITMRIPKDKFLTALDKINALGKVESSFTNSQDVGQEYANLRTQLDTTMIVYNKMLEALQKRQATIPEAMRLESELTPVLRRIEELKNKLDYLNNAVSFTTITVNFHEPQVSAKVLKETRGYIQQRLLIARINAVKFFANAIPAIVPVVVWIIIIAGAVLLIKYWVTRLFKRG